MADEEYISGWTEDFDEEAHRERMKWRHRYNAEYHKAQYAKWLEMNEKYKDNWDQRNWDVWHEYRTTKISQIALGEKYGVTGSCISNIIKRYDKKAKEALNMNFLNPVGSARDGMLDVEFVFRHDETISIHDPKLREWKELNNKDGVSFRCRKQDEDDG